MEKNNKADCSTEGIPAAIQPKCEDLPKQEITKLSIGKLDDKTLIFNMGPFSINLDKDKALAIGQALIDCALKLSR